MPSKKTPPPCWRCKHHVSMHEWDPSEQGRKGPRWCRVSGCSCRRYVHPLDCLNCAHREGVHANKVGSCTIEGCRCQYFKRPDRNKLTKKVTGTAVKRQSLEDHLQEAAKPKPKRRQRRNRRQP